MEENNTLTNEGLLICLLYEFYKNSRGNKFELVTKTAFFRRTTTPSPSVSSTTEDAVGVSSTVPPIGKMNEEDNFSLSKSNEKYLCPGWGSNSRPSDYETDALPTALPRLQDIYGQNVYSAPLCFLLMQNGYTHGGTRTPNLRFRRPTPYPLGHAGIGTGGAQRKNVHK